MPLNFIRDDITRLSVDAIVNAANNSLLGGGGVDGAIHRAAGPELLAECRTLGGCETGEAKITKGYHLPAKHVIHTVGPIYRDGKHGEEPLLRSCYRNSLNLARENNLLSVAFPLISAGVYGYPVDQAIAVAIDEIRAFLFTDDTDMDVTLVLFDPKVTMLSKKLLGELREQIDDSYAEAHYNENRVESRRRKLFSALRKEKAAGKARREAYPDAASEAFCDEECADVIEAYEAPQPEPPMPAAPVQALSAMAQSMAGAPMSSSELQRRLNSLDESFTEMLLRKIDERGMTDSECYKKANIDRKLFSKIRSNLSYRPKKTTVFAFAIALRLSLAETEEMLKKAGFALSESNKTDVIIRYFIERGNYDIFDINEALYDFNEALLGA